MHRDGHVPVNKYQRTIRGLNDREAIIDVYDVLVAFAVACPARQHAIKKLLCAGLRGKGSECQDLTEAGESVARAVEISGGVAVDYERDELRQLLCARLGYCYPTKRTLADLVSELIKWNDDQRSVIALVRGALLGALEEEDTGQDLVPLVRRAVTQLAMATAGDAEVSQRIEVCRTGPWPIMQPEAGGDPVA